jgi:outer membrane protein OmpA-like peptidoglycan-associated protein
VEPPDKVLGFTGTARSTDSIVWEWTPSETAEGYRIFTVAENRLLREISAGETQWVETGLHSGTSYTRYIVAYLDGVNSVPSEPITVTTVKLPPEKVVKFVGIAKSTYSIEWTWKAGDGTQGYKIYNSANSQMVKEITAGTHTWTETGLVQDTVYTRFIKAFNDVGESIASENVTVRTIEAESVRFVQELNKVARNFRFDISADTLRAESIPVLDKIAVLLKKYNPRKVYIEGHTDNQGDAAQNLELSTRRAGTVKKYLEGQGIPPEKLESFGYGLTRPIADNNTEEGRFKNRRVEFVVITEDGVEIRSTED